MQNETPVENIVNFLGGVFLEIVPSFSSSSLKHKLERSVLNGHGLPTLHIMSFLGYNRHIFL